MACLIPALPGDVKCIIAEQKFKMETQSYAAFCEDFVVDVLSYEEELGKDIENFYAPINTDKYNLKITYKPTGLSFQKTMVVKSSYPSLRLTPIFIKEFAIQEIRSIARDVVKGEWQRNEDKYGCWYHCGKLQYNVIHGNKYEQWQKQTMDLQRVMMNRFDKFIAM